MKELSDDILLEAYYRSIDLKLNDDFIKILEDELKSRGIIAS